MFPTTRSSAVADLLSGDPERQAKSVSIIAEAYWRPCCHYLRLRWRATDGESEDLVQSFFETVVRRGLLMTYEPDRARFRTFLRTCLDRHAIDQYRRRSARRRGGGAAEIELSDAEDALADDKAVDPDKLFEAEWLRHLMQLAIARLDERLTAGGKAKHAALFRAFHVGDNAPSYADAATTHACSVTDVTNWLHAARKEFRKVALELLRELTIDDDDFAAEAMAVFGIDVSRSPADR
jgi:RNA polymerase sigma factor (sigma-70 family)